MARGVGPSGDGEVWVDGYQFQGPDVEKDPRHEHAAIYPKFRSGAADLRRSLHEGFDSTSSLDAPPMDPRSRDAQGGREGGPPKGASPKRREGRGCGDSQSGYRRERGAGGQNRQKIKHTPQGAAS